MEHQEELPDLISHVYSNSPPDKEKSSATKKQFETEIYRLNSATLNNQTICDQVDENQVITSRTVQTIASISGIATNFISKLAECEPDYESGAIPKILNALPSERKTKRYKSNSLLHESLKFLCTTMRDPNSLVRLKWLLNCIMLINLEEILENAPVNELDFSELLMLTETSLFKLSLIDFPRYYRKTKKCFDFPSFVIYHNQWKDDIKQFYNMILDYLVPLISPIKTPMFGYSFAKLKVCIFMKTDNERIKNLWKKQQKSIIPFEMSDGEKYIDSVNSNLDIVKKYAEKLGILLNCYSVEDMLYDCMPVLQETE